MNTWKVILATLIIFGTGVITGGLLQQRAQRHGASGVERAAGAPRSAHTISARGLRLDFLRRMQRELDLSPQQRERIDVIITQSQERTKQLMQPVVAQLHEEVRKAKEQFRAVLTPEQRARFDELVKLHRSRESRRPPASPNAH